MDERPLKLQPGEEILLKVGFRQTWDGYRLDLMAWIVIALSLVPYALLTAAVLGIAGFAPPIARPLELLFLFIMVCAIVTLFLIQAVLTLTVVERNYPFVLTNKRVVRYIDYIFSGEPLGKSIEGAERVVYVERYPEHGYLLVYRAGVNAPERIRIPYLSHRREDFLKALRGLFGGKLEERYAWKEKPGVGKGGPEETPCHGAPLNRPSRWRARAGEEHREEGDHTHVDYNRGRVLLSADEGRVRMYKLHAYICAISVLGLDIALLLVYISPMHGVQPLFRDPVSLMVWLIPLNLMLLLFIVIGGRVNHFAIYEKGISPPSKPWSALFAREYFIPYRDIKEVITEDAPMYYELVLKSGKRIPIWRPMPRFFTPEGYGKIREAMEIVADFVRDQNERERRGEGADWTLRWPRGKAGNY